MHAVLEGLAVVVFVASVVVGDGVADVSGAGVVLGDDTGELDAGIEDDVVEDGGNGGQYCPDSVVFL